MSKANVAYTINPAEVDLNVLSELYALVGMRKRKSEELRRALASSSDCVSATCAGKLIGFGRLVSDEVYYGGIWDIAVDPTYQKRGIGTRITELLIEQAKSRGLYMIGLFTVSTNRSFYENLGFSWQNEISAMIKELPNP